MNDQDLYEELKHCYQTGDLNAFRGKFKTISRPHEEIQLLAIKVFKEANAWSQLFGEVENLKNSKHYTYHQKGEIYEVYFDFLLNNQSRKNGQKVL